MWNYIVLGQVPGTDYYLNFTSVLILYGLVLLGIFILGLRQVQRDVEPTQSFDIVQLSLLDAIPPRVAVRENALISLYVCIALMIVVKISSWQRIRLRTQLSTYYQNN